MAANVDDLLEYVWYLESTPQSRQQFPSVLFAGALCVHEDGILITVAHSVRLANTVFSAPKIKARRCQDNGFLTATPIEELMGAPACGSSFGLLMLKVSNPNNEKFPCYNFDQQPYPSSPQEGERIRAFVYETEAPFTTQSARINVSLTGNIGLSSSESDPFTFIPTVPGTLHITLGRTTYGRFLYNGSGFISNREYIRYLVGSRLQDHFQSLNQTMPLILVKRFLHTTMDGLCGWPAFKASDYGLVGLLMFSTGEYQYIIPTQIIRQLCQQNLNLMSSFSLI